MKYSHDIIIIGAGSAGLTAAYGCSQLGMKTALVEKDKMGGDCLNYGCVPSKTLIHIASLYHTAKVLEQYGLPKAEVASPSAEKVMSGVQEAVARLAHHDSRERFESLGVDVHLKSAEYISPHEVKLGDGEVLSAKRFIIASGSSAKKLPIPGLEEAGYVTNKTVFSIKEFPRHLLVIGAGPLGTELTQAFSRLGVKVSLLDIAGRVLPGEDPDMSEIIHRQLRNEGIELVLGASLESVRKEGGQKIISLTLSGKKMEISGDEILLAAGRTGNIQGLGLDAAGVGTAGGFISVDKKLRTSAKNIMAIGDVNGEYLFTHVAGAEGSFAVRKFALHLPGKFTYAHIPRVIFTDPELASVGYNEETAEKDGISYTVQEAAFQGQDRAETEGRGEGKIKVLLDKKGRVIGTQIIGAGAGELITLSLFAEKNGWKLSNFSGVMYPYPILGEIHKKAAQERLVPKLFNSTVRSLLRFLFSYRGIH